MKGMEEQKLLQKQEKPCCGGGFDPMPHGPETLPPSETSSPKSTLSPKPEAKLHHKPEIPTS